MIAVSDQQRVARAVLTYLAEPGDPVLAALLDVSEPVDVVTAVTAGQIPAEAWAVRGPGRGGQRDQVWLERAFATWRRRYGALPSEIDLAGFHRDGIRLVCPGEPEWPTQLDVLGADRPYALWLRGDADLRYCCLRSVAMVGARSATAYGAHVCTEMAAALGARGWTVISGGAFGIDASAHRGALAADGVTVAVLACGVDYAYPRGHHDLFDGIAAQGVLVSEWPPGRPPTRHRFLIRNRVIGALARGTVVVEAGVRSGALNTARHARDLGRPVMAVPGPVTSEVSAGCHKIIREWGAVCVTDAHEVIELLTPFDGEHPDHDGPHPDLDGGQGDRDGGPADRAHQGQLSSGALDRLSSPGQSVAARSQGQVSPDMRGQLALDLAEEHDSARQNGPAEESSSEGEHSLGREHSPEPRDSTQPRDSPAGTLGPAGHRSATGQDGRGSDGGPPNPSGAHIRFAEPVVARTALDAAATRVLEAMPSRGAGPATIAVSAGLSVDAVLRSLGLLAAGGFVERCSKGWRIRRHPAIGAGR